MSPPATTGTRKLAEGNQRGQTKGVVCFPMGTVGAGRSFPQNQAHPESSRQPLSSSGFRPRCSQGVVDKLPVGALATGEKIQAILRQETDEQKRYRLAMDMARSSRIDDRLDDSLAKLKKMAEGFSEIFQKRAGQ